MKRKNADASFAAHLPNILQYHQQMLADGVRNRLLYQAIKQTVTPATNFLDVGAGAGAWAILAAKLGAKRVVAVEIEESLIPVIHRHAQENGVAHRIEIIHANSDDAKIRGKFDVIVSELFGDYALGEASINSFVRTRERFLAPGGALIPQKFAMFAVPSKTENSVLETPAELPMTTEFLKSLKMNYPNALPLAERGRLKFLAEPQKLAEVDFRIVERAPLLDNLTAEWQLEDLQEANSIAVFYNSVFADDIRMDSFRSQSWKTLTYDFEPFTQPSGTLKFTLTINPQRGDWSISLPSHPTERARSYSPVFAFTKLKMAQQTVPHRRYKPPTIAKGKTKKSKKTRKI